MNELVQLTQEQLEELLDKVRQTATNEAIKAVKEEANKKNKASFSNCPARFDGERSMEEVESFITNIETFKDIENITDEEALKGLTLLFYGHASTWWQSIRKDIKTWQDAIKSIRENFSPAKQPYNIYMDIFQKQQDQNTVIDKFIVEKRALLSQLPNGRHDEETEIDLIFGLLNIKYRKHIVRGDVKNFKELLEKSRLVEQNAIEAEAIQNAQQRSKAKRCTFCNFRGHTFQECRKRKQGKNGNEEKKDAANENQ